MKHLLIFTLLISVFILNGCDKPIPEKHFVLLDNVDIVLMDKYELNKMYKKKEVNGLCYSGDRKIYVMYSGAKDINGNPLPVFETLGHEIWHLKELGGSFHK